MPGVTATPRADSSVERDRHASSRPAAAWHAMPVPDVLAALPSATAGLGEAEAARRLAIEGANRLRRTPPTPALRVLIDQLTGVVVFLLVAAFGVSLLLGDVLEAGAIGVVLAVNTLIGFWTELRARRAMEALGEFETDLASVVRDGALRQVAAETIVPGDIVELGAGERIPADGRLVSTIDLRVNEAALTGESLPISKAAEAAVPSDSALADRRTMVYKGTAVSAGSARVVVTATGERTEIGRIGVLVSGLGDERTPLERRLDVFGRHLAWLALAVAALVAGLGALQGAPLALTLEMGIALAVAAVPEALPAVATIALAVGLHRMARRAALVRRLPAVEALGSTTVVCTDKTRTLTSGDMTVVRVWADGRPTDLRGMARGALAGEVAGEVLVSAALASRARAGDESPDAGPAADPVDRAMIRAATEAGFDLTAADDAQPQLGAVPFSSERQLMASVRRVGERKVAMVKGAPARVLDLCTSLLTADGQRRLDAAGRQALLDANASLAGRALRVLGVARGDVRGTAEDQLGGLTFLGFVGLMDPPAEGVPETIARLRAAGLRTVMLTGDQRLTAETIGRQLGLSAEGVSAIDGPELESLPPGGLAARVGDTGVFSRVSPEQKLRIIEALQARGEVVAMLGDGVNDAPALKRADVGVAMGRRGTDVARESADIVLQDDRFETIAAAVEEGRVIYRNIRKFVFYLFSCNVAEVLVLMTAGLAGWPHPLTPLQILWLNMVTDTFPALALALEPADPDVMRQPPRPPGESLLSGGFFRAMAIYGSLITAVTLAAFVSSSHDDPAHARTMAFMTLAFAQVFHLGNARSLGPVLALSRIVANPYALAAVALSVGLQALAYLVGPLAGVLRLTTLTRDDWLLVVGLAAVPALAGQGFKLLRGSR